MGFCRFFLLFCILCVGCTAPLFRADDLTASSEVAKKTRVGFFLRSLNVRGVEVSTYDYADCNETILGNESFIFYVDTEKMAENNPDFPVTVRRKFQERFGKRFHECANFAEVESLISTEQVDVLYNQKSGTRDEHVSSVCKNAVHAVFFPLEVHGDAYATISEWMCESTGVPGIPLVSMSCPYMVRLEESSENLREELGIPRGAVVFGRHGGYTTFDVKFAWEAVVEMARIHPDWYFLFLNTYPFCRLPNVIFLPSTADMVYKTKFINTCDAMIHARHMGETFGLACAEFSIKNKPVITYTKVRDLAHIDMLGSKGLYYRDKQQLQRQIEWCGTHMGEVRTSNWDAYSERCNPRAVMEQFDAVFLKPLRGTPSTN